MHILVTGATGFVGRALCAELHRRGHQISALARNAPQAAVWLPPRTQILNRFDDLGDEVPEAVINLAGENLAARKWDAARKQELIVSRVDLTRQLVNYIRDSVAKPRVLVSGSAVGWYGGARGDAELTEDSTPGREDEFQAALCQAWEDEARRAEDYGLRVCRVRTGLVLAPDGGILQRMRLPLNLGITGMIGDGHQWMSWIHRADLVSLLIKLCENESLSGAYNATAPQPVTNREFVATLSECLDGPAVLPVPVFALKWALGEMSELLLTGQRVLPQRVLDAHFGFRHPELAGALKHIFKRRTDDDPEVAVAR